MEKDLGIRRRDIRKVWNGKGYESSEEGWHCGVNVSWAPAAEEGLPFMAEGSGDVAGEETSS